ncbi:MAG: YhgN family NAAT transporter [Simkaniaceae bacterium]
MLMDYFTTTFSIAFSLFLLMDPIGNIPIYILLLKEIDPARQKKIILRELVIALGIIIGFRFIGKGLLDFLGISEPTILLAGGLILFIISIRMIFPPERTAKSPEFIGEEPFIVPLAIPLVAGPSVLSAVIIYSNQIDKPFLLITAIVIAWIATTIILLSATFLKRILGQRGIAAMERLMGLILILISSQMFLNGLRLFLQQHD